MRVNNITFGNLYGLKESENQKILKDYTQTRGRSFLENAESSFKTINEITGDIPVGVKITEKQDDELCFEFYDTDESRIFSETYDFYDSQKAFSYLVSDFASEFHLYSRICDLIERFR